MFISPITQYYNSSSTPGAVSSPAAAFADIFSAKLGEQALGGLDESGVKEKLMLLLAMLSTGGGAGEVNMLGMQITMLLAGLAKGEQEDIRKSLLSSDYTRPVLERANDLVFSSSAADIAIPFNASKAVNPTITSSVYNRSASLYRAVIDQFEVETNPRYAVNKKGRNDTYCNIFVWDVTRAMGAEIPHYVDPVTLDARYYPDVKGARELNANGIYDWLQIKGEAYGWRRVTKEEAQAYADSGRPAIAVKKNPNGHGHVMMICPDRQGVKTDGVKIAQAGSRLTSCTPLSKLYGSGGGFTFYVHE